MADLMADQAECAVEEQYNELVLMTAMYERDLELFFAGELLPDVPPPRNYSVKLEISGSIVELFVSVPSLYPLVEYPAIRVSADCEEFDVNELNMHLRAWVMKQELGEPMIAQLIEELRAVLHSFTPRRGASDGCGGSVSSGETVRSEYDDKLARYWILSHHMYSQAKRHEVLKHAKAYGLSGFSTPGKPAVIVVEGDARMVQDYWSYVRTMSWHKITLMEEELVPSSQKDFLRFSGFKEMCYDAGGDHKRVDIAEVRKLLEQNNLESHFKNLYNI